MKSVGAIAVILFTVGVAHASDVDWKFYGSTSDHVCLYNNESVVRGAGGNTRVWIECLSKFDLASIDIARDFGGKILQNANRKAAHHYVPPVAAVIEYSDYERMRTIATWEEIANVAHIEPQVQILYEFSCSERMVRELRFFIQTDDNSSRSSDEPGGWRFIPPEGGGATLLKLLCHA